MNYYKTCVYGTQKKSLKEEIRFCRSATLKKPSYEWLYQDNLWIFSSCMYL